MHPRGDAARTSGIVVVLECAMPRGIPLPSIVLRCAVFIAASATVLPVSAGPSCPLQSGPHRTPVLELYTSEGCSSCPPADRWLSMNFDPARPRTNAVPLAFHVDYWDRLGWPDRFADRAYSQRQNEAARRARSRTVYTPQFVFDGGDAGPGGIAAQLVPLSQAAARQAPARTIAADIARQPDGTLRITGSSLPASGGPAMAGDTFVALYQNALMSRIAAGENAGRSLRHDFVVRRFAGPFPSDAAGRAVFDVRWTLPAEFRAEDAGVAIFTEDPATGRTLQAVAGPLCPGG
jgi:hypothetical protein